MDGEASENRVEVNSISISASPGIFLGPNTSNNKVHRNEVFFMGMGGFETVQDLGTDNRVSGNKP